MEWKVAKEESGVSASFKGLFKDADFPEDLSFLHLPNGDEVVWKRPKEIREDAMMFDGSPESTELEQGMLADCWLVSALTAIGCHPHLLSRVIPGQQGLNSPYYKGKLTISFWRMGEWVEMDIDDRLPTSKQSKKLLFLKSKAENVFWASLIEKAFAKLYGGYGELNEGVPQEALIDLTGGLTEIYDTRHLPRDFLLELKRYSDQGTIILATSNSMSIVQDSADSGDSSKAASVFDRKYRSIRRKGSTISGHGYTITAVQLPDLSVVIPTKNKALGMIRIRNPFGKIDWGGNWVNAAEEYKLLPEPLRKSLGLVTSGEGEFYLTYEDFLKAFAVIYTCTVAIEVSPGTPTPDPLVMPACWISRTFKDKWSRNIPTNYVLSKPRSLRFQYFPQYKVWIEDGNAAEEHISPQVEVIVSLVQSGLKETPTQVSTYKDMQFFLFKMDLDLELPLGQGFFRYSRPVAASFIGQTREISVHLKIAPGLYLFVLVPEPGATNEYILRVATPAKFCTHKK